MGGIAEMERALLRQMPGTRRLAALVVAIGLATTGARIALAWLLARIVAAAFLGHWEAGPWYFAAFLAAAALHAVLVGCREAVAQGTVDAGTAGLRARLLAHLFRLGPARLRDERTGEIAALAGDGIERMQPYAARYRPQVALSMLVPLLIGAAVATQDWVSAVILLATAPVLPLLMALVGTYSERHIRHQWQALARMSAHFLDMVQGLTTLKLFGRGDAARLSVARVAGSYQRGSLGALRYAFLSGLVLEFITAGAIAIVAVTLGLRLIAGAIGFERALFVLLLTPEFYRPLRDLGQHRHAAMEAREPAARIGALLDREGAPAAPAATAFRLAGPPRIACRGVGYLYPGGARPALIDVDTELPPGTRTALVGPSGAGKSTLLQVLLRFIEPDHGWVEVNGLRLGALPVEAWRAHLAYVPQRPYLFAGSILENIRLGRPESSRREVEAAAALAGAASFIERCSRGYDTPIGQRGLNLSGGEAQRLAIARAFLKDAPLLLLDEPTAHLDLETEAQIRVAMDRLMRGRTVLIAAHRLQTVRGADQILVLDGGRVVEAGMHRDLVSLGGMYARLIGDPATAVPA